jgi:hypothetical protein
LDECEVPEALSRMGDSIEALHASLGWLHKCDKNHTQNTTSSMTREAAPEGTQCAQDQIRELSAAHDVLSASLSEHEVCVLNARSERNMQFLLDNVLPELTAGMIEVTKQQPDDPIGYLVGGVGVTGH